MEERGRKTINKKLKLGKLLKPFSLRRAQSDNLGLKLSNNARRRCSDNPHAVWLPAVDSPGDGSLDSPRGSRDGSDCDPISWEEFLKRRSVAVTIQAANSGFSGGEEEEGDEDEDEDETALTVDNGSAEKDEATLSPPEHTINASSPLHLLQNRDGTPRGSDHPGSLSSGSECSDGTASCASSLAGERPNKPAAPAAAPGSDGAERNSLPPLSPRPLVAESRPLPPLLPPSPLRYSASTLRPQQVRPADLQDVARPSLWDDSSSGASSPETAETTPGGGGGGGSGCHAWVTLATSTPRSRFAVPGRKGLEPIETTTGEEVAGIAAAASPDGNVVASAAAVSAWGTGGTDRDVWASADSPSSRAHANEIVVAIIDDDAEPAAIPSHAAPLAVGAAAAAKDAMAQPASAAAILQQAHLLAWGFRFEEAHAAMLPLRVATAQLPSGSGGWGGGGADARAGPSALGLWLRVTEVEQVFLRALLAAGETAAAETVARVKVTEHGMRALLPRGTARLRVQELMCSRLVLVARAAAGEAASDALTTAPSLAAQTLVMELELCVVSAAAHMMAGQLVKAAAAIRKLIKHGFWLIKATDRLQAVAADANPSALTAKARGERESGKDGLPAWLRPALSPRGQAAGTISPSPSPSSSVVCTPFWGSGGASAADSSAAAAAAVNAAVGEGPSARSSPRRTQQLAFAASWFDWVSGGTASSTGASSPVGGSLPRAGPADDELATAAVASASAVAAAAAPTEFAAPAPWDAGGWVALTSHVEFLAGCMHVGLSLLPRQLIPLLGHCLGYSPSLEKGVELLVRVASRPGLRRPAAAAILELLLFREAKRRAKQAGRSRADSGDSNSLSGSHRGKGRHGGDGGSAGSGRAAASSAAAAAAAAEKGSGDETLPLLFDGMAAGRQVLEEFYTSFPIAPLLSLLRAKSHQLEGRFREAERLCDAALQVIVAEAASTATSGPMLRQAAAPPAETLMLALQLGHAQFFQRMWSPSLALFSRVVMATEAAGVDQRSVGGLSAAFAAAAACGAEPDDRRTAFHWLRRAADRLKMHAAGAKEQPVLRGRIASYIDRGSVGAEVWLFEFLYLHNASSVKRMPPAWHEAILETLTTMPLAAALRPPTSGSPNPAAAATAAAAVVATAERCGDALGVATTQVDAALALCFFRGLVLYKLGRAAEALACLEPIVSMVRDADETDADARAAVAAAAERGGRTLPCRCAATLAAVSASAATTAAVGRAAVSSKRQAPQAGRDGGRTAAGCPAGAIGGCGCHCPQCAEMVQLQHSRFVLPHALFLTAVLSYRLQPDMAQLAASHDLCKRAKKFRNYDFDISGKGGKLQWLMNSLEKYMN